MKKKRKKSFFLLVIFLPSLFCAYGNYKKNGWMACDFTSFSTVFQSYEDNERLIMKGCVQCNSIQGLEVLPQAGIELGPLD